MMRLRSNSVTSPTSEVDTRLLLALLSVACVEGAGISSTVSPSTISGRSTTLGRGGGEPRAASDRAATSLFDLDAAIKHFVESPQDGAPARTENLKVIQEQARTKRNGGDDFLTSALTSKSGFLDSLKTAYGDVNVPATYPEPEKKSFSVWGFKKAIFGTLLQAVKAITGGVIALKGQLIKVTGHITATKGKVLATKGDVISELGRHIASKALAQPFYHYEGLGHSGYTAPTGPSYGHHGYPSYPSYPSAPVYGPPHHSYPSAPAYYSDYHRLSRHSKPAYNAAQNPPAAPVPAPAPQPHSGQLPPGVQAGLLVLKPVQVPVGHNGLTHGPPSNKVPTQPPSAYSSIHPSGYSHPPAPALPQQSPYSVAPQLFHNPVQPRYPTNNGAYQVSANQESFENYDAQESRFQYPHQPSQNNYHDSTKRSPIKRLFEVPTGPGFDFAS